MQTHVLRLFVAGNTPKSNNAILRLRELCEMYLKGNYQLTVVDIYQQASLARSEQIVATPTLIKYSPIPKKIWVGDLTNTDRILSQLSLIS